MPLIYWRFVRDSGAAASMIHVVASAVRARPRGYGSGLSTKSEEAAERVNMLGR